MLMEPDEYTSQERALTDKAKELIEQHELDWGNGECFIQRDAGHSELYMTLEAPNHATVTVTVPAEADEKGLRRAMADGLLDFDPDEEFDECWSREFAARNGFTPSGFLRSRVAFSRASSRRSSNDLMLTRAATGDAVDVLRETMGAMPAASVGEDDGVSPIDLDLGYVLPGAVTSFAERAQACDPSDPLNMTDTAGSGLSK
ncbi:hypothetical protein [Bifidobacterium longum]|uniref:hypothetical protein n=1 Tax=Bifidobacterium longum TaxID=216816 RepID=UPI0023ED2855|nr:hypothetical protein [Bifidobacterium longum]MDF4078794.1 hypothetical protein [Bifidobacterium longum]MDF4089430.1 hypothetical protein [Bifidobacterium longum]